MVEEDKELAPGRKVTVLLPVHTMPADYAMSLLQVKRK